MRKVWIVVANGSDARIFKAESVNHLVEVRNLEHPESRLPNSELSADKQGRSMPVSPKGFGPHTIENKQSPKTREKDYFAEEIRHTLAEGFNKGEFDRLYLIAHPPFDSMIRKHLDPQIDKLIEKEIHKDLLQASPAEIRQYLPPVL